MKRRIALLLCVSMLITSISVPTYAGVDNATEIDHSSATPAVSPTETPSTTLLTTTTAESSASDTTNTTDITATTVTVSENAAVKLTEFEKSKTINGIKITVSAPEGVFPMDAVLDVQQIIEQGKLTQIEQAIENSQNDTAFGNAADAGSQSGNTVSDNAISASTIANETLTFNITILDSEGNEIQPDTTKGEVKVTFANVEVTDAEGNEKDVEVFHIDDELKTAEPVAAVQVDAGKQEVEIAAEHFSVYVVVIGDMSRINQKITEVTKFQYKWGDDGADDATDYLYYWDKFFSAPATTYNPSLATTSMAMTQACSGAGEGNIDPRKWAKNGIDVLQRMGFQDVTSNASEKGPELDSIGITIGYKLVDEYELDADGKPTQTIKSGRENIPIIMVGIRGSNYQGEWGGNFYVNGDHADYSDSETDHKGFYVASTKVIDYVQNYIATNDALKDKNEIKLWITGFSRAAATSNLTAARIDREISNISGSLGATNQNAYYIAEKINGKTLNKGNVNLYAYTFETPSGGIDTNRLVTNSYYEKKEIYNNIHNVINPADLVPMVAPEEWGFGQYGVNHYLPTKENHYDYQNLTAHMLKYKRGRMINENIDHFKNYRFYGIPLLNEQNIPSLGIFMQAFVENLANNAVKSRANMSAELPNKPGVSFQGSLRELVKLMMVGDDALLKSKLDMIKWLQYVGESFLTKEGWPALSAILRGDTATYKKLLPPLLIAAAKKCGFVLTQQKAEQLIDSTDGITDLLYYLVFTDISKLVTLILNEANYSVIEAAHSMTMSKLWLESMDPFYDQESNEGGATHIDYKTVMLSGEYRVIRVSTKDDKEIKKINVKLVKLDANGNEAGTYTVGSTTSEEQEDGFGTIIDDYSMITVYAPMNQSYKLIIERNTANHPVDIRYSVHEYNPCVDYTHLANSYKYLFYYKDYFTINNEDGKQYIAQFPAATADIQSAGMPTDRSVESGKTIDQTDVYRLKYEGTGEYINVNYEEKKGIELSNKFSNIVLSEGYYDQLGYTSGSGKYMLGEVAVLVASAFDDSEFEGWYADNLYSTKLSGDSIYSFPITDAYANGSEKYIYAKFNYTAEVNSLKAENSSKDSDPAAKPKITLTWQKPVGDEASYGHIYGYKVERGTYDTVNHCYDYEEITTIADRDTLTFTDGEDAAKPLTAGTKYKYKVTMLSVSFLNGASPVESINFAVTEQEVTAGSYWSFTDSKGDITYGYTVDRTQAPKGNQVSEHQQNDPVNSVFTIQAGHEYLRSMDIKVVNTAGEEVFPPTAYIPPVKVIINLGTQYNGRQVTVQHKIEHGAQAGTVERFENLTVVNGAVAVEVENFSPFFVTVSKLPAPQPTPTPDNGNTSSYSGSSQTTDYPVPYAPQYVQAQNYGMDLTGKPQVMLMWQKPAMDEAGLRQIAGYSVYRDGVWIGTVNGVNMLYYIDNTVENGKTYRYTVKTLGIEGGTESVASNEAVITVDALKAGAADPTFTASRAAGETTDGSQSGFNRADAAQADKNQSGDVAAKINQAGAVQEDNPVTATDPTQKVQNTTDSTSTEAADSQQAMKRNQTGNFAGGIAKVAVPVGIGVLLLCGLLILILLKRRNHDDMES
ncbi:MAG: fibronectin type III domain-containing protein [bacterium]|nr:fibronectin type III domain-containing protein [bacterium]